MRYVVWMIVTLTLMAPRSEAQNYGYGASGSYGYGAVGSNYYDGHGGMVYDSIGSPVPSASEPLYQYDDLEVWKHGWLQINPYEHGYHSYRPYNYKQVLAQAAQSSMWGMPSTMPYSQSYYLRYGPLTGINGQPIPTGPETAPQYNGNAPGYGDPSYGYPPPSSMNSTSPLRQQPFDLRLYPHQFNDSPGLTQLPGHQFAPPYHPPVSALHPAMQTISPANFQQFHNGPASGPEFQRQRMQQDQIRQLLQQGAHSR